MDEKDKPLSRFGESAFMDLVKSSPVALCITDQKGRFVYVNSAYCRLYGYSEEELIGREFIMVVDPSNMEFMKRLHLDFVKADASDVERAKTELQAEWRAVDQTGNIRFILANAVRLSDYEGSHYKATFVVDITERKKIEDQLRMANEKLRHLSMHDELTSLFNRRAGFNRLDDEIEISLQSRKPLSIATIDLDHFKLVNDLHGHSAGDEVLTVFSSLMRAGMREGDAAVRLGGEELLLIMPGTDASAAKQCLNRLRDQFSQASLSAAGLKVTFSAGIAQLQHETRKQFMDRADRALYRAKRKGRDCIVHAEET